ncbi:MAG TPA: hypothetical protein VD731_07510 [Nitrosopumilaceae archaeon]|nr:hypothetical protein [Nitrosopumilaceae archaeon]
MRYISKTTQSMSTIQVTKEWQPQPTKSLVESNPVEEGKKLSNLGNDALSRTTLCAKDMMGLSWVLSDDLESIFNGNDIW